MASWKSSVRSAADRLGSAAKRAANSAPTAFKRVAAGFTSLGPAAGSYAAAWMSSTTLANGVGVTAGSSYAAAQSAAMGGTALVGAPIVVGVCATCAVAGSITMAVIHFKRGGSGDAPGPDDSTEGELSAEDSTEGELSADEDGTEGDEHSDEVLGQ